MLPTLPSGVFYNSRKMEGLWDGIEAGGLPLSFHVGETFDARGLGGLATTIVVALQPYRRLFALLTYSGILERHPELRVVFTEGGISWVAASLYDFDRIYTSFESEMNPKLARKPSHYWFQNCFATFMGGSTWTATAGSDRLGQGHVVLGLPAPREHCRLLPAVDLGHL